MSMPSDDDLIQQVTSKLREEGKLKGATVEAFMCQPSGSAVISVSVPVSDGARVSVDRALSQIELIGARFPQMLIGHIIEDSYSKVMDRATCGVSA